MDNEYFNNRFEGFYRQSYQDVFSILLLYCNNQFNKINSILKIRDTEQIMKIKYKLNNQ
jgi:hypothetical protein